MENAPTVKPRRRRWRRVLLIGLTSCSVFVGAASFYLLYAPAPPEPHLSAAIQSGTIRIGDRDRTYLLYVPARLPPSPPLVFVLHGSRQTADDMRISTGYEFERLADEKGFVAVYPNGYEKNWNDCRKRASYPARLLKIDDVGLFLGLIDRLQASIGINPKRVFAVGYSNGGQFAFRLALQQPERVAGIAVFGANLPTDDNSDCQHLGKAVPVMIVNGTSDPINPFDGGDVTIFGFANRGPVLSSRATAEYFANLSGHAEPKVKRLPAEGDSGGTFVEQFRWQESGKAEVILDAVHGGGHVIPQPIYRPKRILGRVSRAINGPAEVLSFFERQPAK